MPQLPQYVMNLAESANWPSITAYGLLPAANLMKLSQPEGMRTLHRRNHTVLPNGVHIRDQGPMPPKALNKCLAGMAPAAEGHALSDRTHCRTLPGPC
jgi:hypothetical protein